MTWAASGQSPSASEGPALHPRWRSGSDQTPTGLCNTYYNLHFHWLAALTDRLNAGVLPPGYFAMIEQRIGGPEPDVITRSTRDADPPTE